MTQGQFNVADIVVSIESQGLPWDFPSDHAFQKFQNQSGTADVHISIHWHFVEDRAVGVDEYHLDVPEVGSSRSLGQVRRDREGVWTFEVTYSDRKAYPRRVGIFSPDLGRGDIYLEPSDLGGTLPNPFGPPLDRLFFAYYLAQNKGTLVHACGVAKDGAGYLFAGPSGSGKSTLAKLWSGIDGVTVLGEECLVLVRRETGFWVYGTPWVGETGLCSNVGVPLHGIFFISHGTSNKLTPLPTIRAVERLLQRTWLATHDPIVAGEGLDLCLEMISRVGAHDLAFVPDTSLIEYLNGV